MSSISYPFSKDSATVPRQILRADDAGRASEAEPLLGLLAAALDYSRTLGWPVLPVSGKRPIIRWSDYQGRLPTEAEISAWPWDTASGLALVCGEVSGVVVLDEDKVRALELLGPLPQTVEARSGRGGRHLYYRIPDGVRLPTSVKVIAPGIDVRGEGSIIVLPPSVHPANGQLYEWVRSPHDYETAVLPDKVVRAIAGTTTASGKDHAEPAQTQTTATDPAKLIASIRSDMVREVLEGGRADSYPSRSEACWFVINALLEEGWGSHNIIAVILSSPLGARYRDAKKRPQAQYRAVEAEIRRAIAKEKAVAVADHPGSEMSELVHRARDWIVRIPTKSLLGRNPEWRLENHETCRHIGIQVGKRKVTRSCTGLACQYLSCETCGPSWRRQVIENMVSRIDPDSERQGYAELYLHRAANEKEYETLTRALNRKMKDELQSVLDNETAPVPGYLRVRRPSSEYFVLSTHPHQKRDGKQPIRMRSLMAAIVATRLLHDVWDKDDARFSHSWSRNRPEPQWRLIARYNDVHDADIREGILAAGAVPEAHEYRWPDDIPDGEIDRTIRQIVAQVSSRRPAVPSA